MFDVIDQDILDKLQANDPSLKYLYLAVKDSPVSDIQWFCEVLAKNKTLQGLRIVDNGLGTEDIKYLAKALAENTALQELNLEENTLSSKGIEYLAAALLKNKTLQKINMSNSNLGTEDIKYLAEALAENTALQELDLEKNTLGSKGMKYLAAALSKNKALRKLNLSNNDLGAKGIKYLAEAFKENVTLQQVDLSDNNFDTEGAKHLAEILAKNNAIEALDLGKVTGEKSIQYLAEALKKNNTLELLNLSGDINEQDEKYLAEAIKENGTLCMLGIVNTSSDKVSIKKLLKALEENKKLHTLNLDFSMDNEDAKCLSEILQRNTTIIDFSCNAEDVDEELADEIEKYLNRNKQLNRLRLLIHQKMLTKQSSDEVPGEFEENILERLLRNDPTLKELDLTGIKMDADASACLAEILAENTFLEELSLSDCNFLSGGAQHISNALKTNETLKILDMSGNKIRNSGVKFLMDSLEVNMFLKELYLSDNNIDIDAAGNIAEMLVKNNVLHSLDLSQNRLNSESMKPLAEALAVNTSLRRLSLSGNVFIDDKRVARTLGDEKSMRFLGEGLAVNAGLQILSFENNEFSNPQAAKYLANALEMNKTLQELNLSGSALDDEGVEFLAAALSKNKSIKKLNLRGNRISNKGIKYLADMLTEKSFLEGIDFEFNFLDDKSIRYLSEALTKNTTLRILNLGEGNNLSKEGVQYLSDMLAVNTTLQEIDLKWEEDNSAVKGLIKTIGKNKGLHGLTLSCMEISSDNIDQLSHALAVNTTLQEFSFMCENLASRDIRFLAESIEKNMTLQEVAIEADNLDDEGLIYLKKIETYLERNRKIVQKNKKSEDSFYTKFDPSLIESTQKAVEELRQQFSQWVGANNTENLAFLNRLSDDTKRFLEELNTQERKALDIQLQELAKQQAELQTTLDPVLRAQQADVQLQKAIEAINQDPQTKLYFETLLRNVDGTLLASLVLCTGKVAQAPTLSARFLTGATGVASACFPPAAPFIALVNQVVGNLGDISNFRDMRRLSHWVNVSSEISHLSLGLAVACTHAKQYTIKTNQPMNTQGQSLLTRLKSKCGIAFEQFKAGEQFTLAQERAIVDTYILLSYMMMEGPQDKAQDKAQDKKIMQLVEHLTGQTLAGTLTVNSMGQTSVIGVPASAVSAQDFNNIVAKMQALELKQQAAEEAEKLARTQAQELSQLKEEMAKQKVKGEILEKQQKKAEETAKLAHEQAQFNAKLAQEQAEKTAQLEVELAKQKDETKKLKKRQEELDKRNALFGSNSNNEDKQNGHQIQIQENALKHPDLPQHVSSAAMFALVYKQTQEHAFAIGALVETTSALQGNMQQVNQEQDSLHNQVERQQRQTEQQLINERTNTNMRLAELEAQRVKKEEEKKRKGFFW